MKIIITGGTGFIGKRVIKRLEGLGHNFVILTRNPQKAQDQIQSDQHLYQQWDGQSSLPKEIFEGVEAAINLVGESIANKRWSQTQKEKIKNSRIKATSALVDGINQHAPSCKVLISASAIGIYPINLDSKLQEDSDLGQGFLPEVCKAWEAQAKKIKEDTRLVITRIGVVLGEEGGALQKLLPIFKLGLGGPVSNGKQIMSWIHVEDLVGIICEALENEDFKGAYNAVSPNPVTNKVFTKALAQALSRPAFFPVPGLALKAAMGEMSTIVLDSQNISGKKVESDGYHFRYSDINQAMKEIVQK